MKSKEEIAGTIIGFIIGAATAILTLNILGII